MTTPHTDTAITVVAADPADRPTLLQTTSAFGAVQFSGLFAGFLATVLVFEASLRGFGAAVYTQVRLIELQHLDSLATALLVPAILAAAALTLALIRRRGSGRWLTVAAVLLQSWSVSAPPGDWSNVRDRWQLAHAARTTTAALAFVLLAAVAVPVQSSRNAVQPSAAIGNNKSKRTTP
jgi:hypothetical protein